MMQLQAVSPLIESPWRLSRLTPGDGPRLQQDLQQAQRRALGLLALMGAGGECPAVLRHALASDAGRLAGSLHRFVPLGASGWARVQTLSLTCALVHDLLHWMRPARGPIPVPAAWAVNPELPVARVPLLARRPPLVRIDGFPTEASLAALLAQLATLSPVQSPPPPGPPAWSKGLLLDDDRDWRLLGQRVLALNASATG